MIPPESPETQDKGVPRLLLVIFGLAALVLAGSLLFWGYQRSRNNEPALMESILPFSGTAESDGAPLDTTLADLVKAGSVAPDFELADLNGETVRLSDFRGRPVILNFWATWCAPCRLEMPELQRAQTGFGDDGPVVLTINQEESAERVTEFFTEVGLTMPALLDPRAKVGVAYGAYFLPTTVIIDSDGIVIDVHRGMISREALDGYLQQIESTEGS